MKINKVTITGADDNTKIEDLIRLSNKYPFVEWGILFSNGREGSQRYPSSQWIHEVTKFNLSLSAHFCGWYPRQVLENANYDLIKNLNGFNRVQLNYNFKNSKGWDLGRLLSTELPINVILQYNKSNADIIENADIPNNFHILYDASGGRGTEIQSIEPTVKGLYTGYAGGLNPDNTDRICQMISNHGDSSEVWIDLESGARTNDEFDLVKVEKILEIASKYIN